MKVLAYIEVKEGKAINGSLEILTPAAALGEAAAVLVGTGLDEAAAQVAAYGVPVTVVETAAASCDELTAALQAQIAAMDPDVILMSGTQMAKDLAPRLAARLNTGCVTDATVVELADGAVAYTRPAYGGTVLEHLTMGAARPQIATLRSGSYSKPEQGAAAAITKTSVEIPSDAIRAKLVEVTKDISEAVNLEGADVIVTAGRGMGSAEDLHLVNELAELLGAEIGATRPVIEEGWMSRAHQVGQSGKIVAPKLYIACGVSGAMQHISGAMGSKYIVAINKDESAPIFEYANVGIVGDVKVILPLLIEEIRKLK